VYGHSPVDLIHQFPLAHVSHHFEKAVDLLGRVDVGILVADKVRRGRVGEGFYSYYVEIRGECSCGPSGSGCSAASIAGLSLGYRNRQIT